MPLGQPIIFISAPAGPVTASPPTIGLTAAIGAFVGRKASRIPGTARIGPMLVTGLLGAKMIASASCDALDHARRRTSAMRSLETHAAYRNLVPLAHEVLLKRQRALRRVEHGRDPIVRHRQHARANPHPAGQFGGRGLSDFPACSIAVRVRWVARSRSPRLNHDGCPSCLMRSRQRKLSSSTPQPRSLLSRPDSP